ncbi:unnamed protein product [Phytophthora lilii]|uniref:Unnamed protein product n=1 Tax=Phytophthora lilii TaxID=2077276 RepID=A0A9W6TBH9_9STRA|nr:unnamed protein product [Phytophthora lilii]
MNVRALLVALCLNIASPSEAQFSSRDTGVASDAVKMVPAGDSTEPSFKFGTPTFFGSGCPADTVTVVPSTDGQAVSVLFSQFAARTSGTDVTRDRKSCNLAVPVDVQSVSGAGSTCALVHCVFDAEYYFAGQRGPVASEKYSPGADKDLFISHEVGVSAVVWSPCGASTNFRVNSAITAVKKSGTTEDTQVAIDSVDSTVQAGFHYFIAAKKCSQ